MGDKLIQNSSKRKKLLIFIERQFNHLWLISTSDIHHKRQRSWPASVIYTCARSTWAGKPQSWGTIHTFINPPEREPLSTKLPSIKFPKKLRVQNQQLYALFNSPFCRLWAGARLGAHCPFCNSIDRTFFFPVWFGNWSLLLNSYLLKA